MNKKTILFFALLFLIAVLLFFNLRINHLDGKFVANCKETYDNQSACYCNSPKLKLDDNFINITMPFAEPG